MTPLLLRVTDLRVGRPGDPAPLLDGVSLTLARGEVLGVVGESGSGKSTLARCLLRQEAPLKILGGEIRFRGENLVGLSQRAMRPLRGRYIGLLPQDCGAALDPLFSLHGQWRALALTHRARLADTQVLEALLARLSLPPLSKRGYPHQWSRGMLQRLLFAMALGPAPELLVLDEPTAALDPPLADRLLDCLRAALAEGAMGVLLITHDLGVAAQVCQRILVLRDGRVLETGAAGTLLRRPEHPYTRELVASGGF